jgi:hypothetical protein
MGITYSDAVDAARGCIEDYIQIKPRETLLIISDDDIDPMVGQAFKQVAKENKAELSWLSLLLATPPSRTTWDGPNLINAAIQNCDAYIILGYPFVAFHSRSAARVLFEYYGKRRLHVIPMSEFGKKRMRRPYVKLRSDIAMYYWEKLRAMEEITLRVTDPKGTDITAHLDCQAMHINSVIGGHNFSGLVPGGEMGWTDGSAMWPPNATGVIYWDEVMGVGWTNPPIKWTIEKGICVDIEGGSEGEDEVLKKFFDGEKRGREFHEMSFGFDPYVEWTGPVHEASHLALCWAAGCFHMCVGNQKLKSCGTKYSNVHVDGLLLRPTVYVNGEIFIQEGVMVPPYIEHPDIRKIAAKYGDPDELLQVSPRPFIVTDYGRSAEDNMGTPGL